MPIVRIGTDLVYYAHVPKCAGSSVEDYLADRFGPLALLDRRHLTRPAPQRWSATSPQHIVAADLARLFPPDFFRAIFAVVRHPARRLHSAYTFQKARRRINLRLSFTQWIDGAAQHRDRAPFVHDNHTRPMSDFVPGDAAVFRLEDGLDAVVTWCDEIAGAPGALRGIPQSNKTENVWWEPTTPWKRWVKQAVQVPVPPLDEAFCRKVHALYPEDYERFGYGVYDPLE